MSIVRTIMKIVLIIIGLAAVTSADDSAPAAQYYISDYYLPYPGQEVYKKDPEQWLSYGKEKKEEKRDVYRIVPYAYQKIGLQGFGFETRLAFADGLRNPITPLTLSPYYDGYRSRSLHPYGDPQYAPISSR